MGQSSLRPVVAFSPDHQVLAALLQNEKGRKKSLERNELWALHPETGRLLPVYPGVPVTVSDHGGWSRADLAELPSHEPFADFASGVDHAATQDVRSDPDNGKARAGDRTSPLGGVLASLAEVIRERHAKMPEGSYTTHLFSSGPEKIRKKMGEEAVELLLARERGELVSETSDFLYHLLVLLEAEGVSLAEIAAELERR